MSKQAYRLTPSENSSRKSSCVHIESFVDSQLNWAPIEKDHLEITI